MRVVVVSDRLLSTSTLIDAVRHIPDSLLVAQVDRFETARHYCQKGEADVVIADASLIDEGLSAIGPLLGELVIQGFNSHISADKTTDRTVAETPAGCGLPWKVGARQVKELSPREREIFFMLGTGFSNRDISRLLGVTEPTVKTHVGHVLAKLELASRLEAGLAAFAHLVELGAASSRMQPRPSYR